MADDVIMKRPDDVIMKKDTHIKLTPLEHILHRPDSYIGSITNLTEMNYVVDAVPCDDEITPPPVLGEKTKKRKRDSGFKIKKRMVTYVPGLLKLYDEILNNAADHRLHGCTKIRIIVTNDSVKIWNNGVGIPIEISEKYGIYIPELIFFNLLSGSNFDDAKKRIVGGRNVIGGKLANVFSKRFILQVCTSGKLYRQEGMNNMSIIGKPKIKDAGYKDDWTQIEFFPDLSKFGMCELNSDFVALAMRRAYDIAASFGISITFNGEIIKIKSMRQYAPLFLGEKACAYYHNDRWDVCVAIREYSEFEAVSYVNGIYMSGGGTHVQYIKNQILSYLSQANDVLQTQLSPLIFILISAIIENPAFSSQTKETLSTAVKDFGSKCELDESFLKKINVAAKESISNLIARREEAKFKALGSKMTKRTLLGITKLTDAQNVGTSMCTLILTEGDSAKALAIAGLSALSGKERATYGVFPLRGKLPNTRDLDSKSFESNAELTSLVKIIGLEFGKTYNNVIGLRYGRIVIMADQDADGSHIKGLIINFFDTFWPSLLHISPPMFYQFITPIVKVTRRGAVTPFYTLADYMAAVQPGDKIKYYKGLGTSTGAEAKEYFSNMRRNVIPFKTSVDPTYDIDAIHLVFEKGKDAANNRKEWLLKTDNISPIEYDSSAGVTYAEFIHRELRLFSLASVIRAIPDSIDGLKPSLRKILYACLKRNLTDDVKVAQLAGYVAEHTAYHHAENSLSGAIVGLAQTYVGTNNINLLVPSGQFGTRFGGDNDVAAPRYIFTRLSKITRKIFIGDDDVLLEHQFDDGTKIEPIRYAPIIPFVLVNGASGIGTGWSCDVLPYNPKNIIRAVREIINETCPSQLIPYFKGFLGSVVVDGDSVIAKGVYRVDGNTVFITELPPHIKVEGYKQFLQKCQAVQSFKENHSDPKISFTVVMTSTDDVETVLKLSHSYSLRNMHLLKNGIIHKYEHVEDIVRDFIVWRMPLYEKRRENLIDIKTKELTKMQYKARFIQEILNGLNIFSNAAEKMIARGFPEHTHEFLLALPMSSMQDERLNKLLKDIEIHRREIEEIVNSTAKSMWLYDLNELEKEVEKEVEKELC